MSPTHVVPIGKLRVGQGQPLLLIAGPCVIENEEETLQTARHLADLAHSLSTSFVFKSSFLKDNRTRGDSPRGPGREEGLQILQKVKREVGCPVITDIHCVEDALSTAEAGIDILQIPAFLCRQSSLLEAAAQTGACVNVKKGQFLSPEDLQHVADKLQDAGCKKILLTERGTTFGYHDLVVDFRGFAAANELGWPWIYDVTHSLQRPSGKGGQSGGTPELVPLMARAAAAAGIQGLFLEAHPQPSRALSDASSQVPLDRLESWLPLVVEIHRQVQEELGR